MAMMNNEDDDEVQPKRDQLGRFVKGLSGNPAGRPPKTPPKPKPLANIFAAALGKEVEVNNSGISQKMEMSELLVTTALRNALKAKPKDILHIVVEAAKIAAEAMPEEVECELTYSEEDRRFLETSR